MAFCSSTRLNSRQHETELSCTLLNKTVGRSTAEPPSPQVNRALNALLPLDAVLPQIATMMKQIAFVLFLAAIGCSHSKDQANDVTPQGGNDVTTERDIPDETFHKILKRYGESLNPSKLPEHHRNFALVYHAHGIIGNGGFQYLFEGNIPGDPGYQMTRQAYQAIGATEACSAFQKAFEVFPKSVPPDDVDRRLEMWQAKYSLQDALTNKQSPDAIYFGAMKATMALLEEYIKKNQAVFDTLN